MPGRKEERKCAPTRGFASSSLFDLVVVFPTVKDQSSKKIDEIRVDQWNTDTLVEYFQERLA
jgi:hypothetical protein